MTTPLRSLYDHTGRLMIYSEVDTYAVYVASFPTDFGLFVKIGMSRAPVRRLFDVHCNSPFPLSTFSWAWVGRGDVARVFEKHAQLRYDQQRTRGEWFRFEGPAAEVDADIRKELDQFNGDKRALDWREGDLAGVLAYAALESRTDGTAMERKAAAASRVVDNRKKIRRLWNHA